MMCAEVEVQELKEEFARRLGEQQRTIDILKVRWQLCSLHMCSYNRLGTKVHSHLHAVLRSCSTDIRLLSDRLLSLVTKPHMYNHKCNIC